MLNKYKFRYQDGIHVEVCGKKDQIFRDNESVIMSFSHASNLGSNKKK